MISVSLLCSCGQGRARRGMSSKSEGQKELACPATARVLQTVRGPTRLTSIVHRCLLVPLRMLLASSSPSSPCRQAGRQAEQGRIERTSDLPGVLSHRGHPGGTIQPDAHPEVIGSC